jgi:hypothetical protein
MKLLIKNNDIISILNSKSPEGINVKNQVILIWAIWILEK